MQRTSGCFLLREPDEGMFLVCPSGMEKSTHGLARLVYRLRKGQAEQKELATNS